MNKEAADESARQLGGKAEGAAGSTRYDADSVS